MKKITPSKLVAECEKKLKNNEYNTRRFMGVPNCSASDVETVKLYAVTVMQNGQYTGTLRRPCGNVAAVLQKCELYEEDN